MDNHAYQAGSETSSNVVDALDSVDELETDLDQTKESMYKNKVVLKERDAWSDLANFIGEMVAKYAEAMDLDNLPDPDFYLRREGIRQLYTELYKEKNIIKFRNTKISVERKVVA